MSKYYVVRADYIVHHGIKGQQWGVENGPPYPLDASDHSSSEKKAGWRSSLDNKKQQKLEKKEKYAVAKQKAADATNKYEESQSKSDRFLKNFVFLGPAAARTYDMARAAGEGRVKAYLRSMFDLNLNSFISGNIGSAVAGGTNMAGTVISGRDFSKSALGMGLGAVATMVSANAIQKSANKKGRNLSLQQRALTKKYYS